jgi:Tol biopolymer transport system component
VTSSLHKLLLLLVLLLIGGATLAAYFVIADPACRKGTSKFTYRVDAKQLRQTDMAVLERGEQTIVTDDHLSLDPSFDPSGQKIVFASGRGGDFHPELGFERLGLFTATSSGSDVERLTSGPFDFMPDWSHDGSKVVFVRGENYGAPRELWVVDVETLEQERVLDRPLKRDLYSPKWSPDGGRIAFVTLSFKENQKNLWLVSSDGSELRQVPHIEDSGTVGWSPDGDQIAYSSGGDIYVVDVEGGRPRLLDQSGARPVWSTDGTRIAYFDHTTEDNYELTVRDSDGGRKYPVEGAPVFHDGGDQFDWATC